METLTTFIFLGSKITSNGDWSHEIKRPLPLGRKAMTDLDSVLKSRDITLLTKVCIVKSMIFPVVMYVYESWTIKKAKCWRTDGFKLWCWRRLLRVTWPARRPNQSILKEINPKHSLEGLDAEAEAPTLWPPDGKGQLTGKDPDGDKDWEQEEKWATEDEMVDGITDSMDMSLSKLPDIVKDREALGAAFHVAANSWTWLST